MFSLKKARPIELLRHAITHQGSIFHTLQVFCIIHVVVPFHTSYLPVDYSDPNGENPVRMQARVKDERDGTVY
jgi:hypothetical protein